MDVQRAGFEQDVDVAVGSKKYQLISLRPSEYFRIRLPMNRFLYSIRHLLVAWALLCLPGCFAHPFFDQLCSPSSDFDFVELPPPFGDCAADELDDTLLTLGLLGAGLPGTGYSPSTGTPTFAVSALSATGVSDFEFFGTATDNAGNVYVVGNQIGAGTLTFATGVSSTTAHAGSNGLIVKYNSSGQAQWARTAFSANNDNGFTSVAVDALGNVYVAGILNDTANFGSGAVTSVPGGLPNGLLVKYDANGNTIFARSTTAGTGFSFFVDVAVDSAGNVYACGGGDEISFDGVTLNSPFAGNNPILVKFNSSGTALWGVTSSTGSVDGSDFIAVDTDLAGNVYVAGSLDGAGPVNFPGGLVATSVGVALSGLLLKFDTNGNGLAVVTSDGNIFRVEDMNLDSAGNLYVSGHHEDIGTSTFGNGVSFTSGISASTAAVVKYSPAFLAQWIRGANGATDSLFFAGHVDAGGIIYQVGWQGGAGSFDYGSGVSVSGSSAIINAVIVAYNDDGTTRWARSTTSGIDDSEFQGVSSDPSGNVYAVGILVFNGTYGFGNGVSVAGPIPDGANSVIVKYE